VVYDGEGRVCAVRSEPIPGTYTMTGYVYDAEGNRVSKGTILSMSCDPSVNGYQATNDYVRGPGGEQLTETGSDGQGNMVWAHTNVYADGKLIATYNPDGLHFHLTDWVGTRRVQTDYEGVVEQTCQSLPYGDGANCYHGPTEQLYAGLERDDESGLDHALYRQYSSAMGRWISPDPYNGSYDLEDPQSLNRYGYVDDNPLVNVDPSGLAFGVLNGAGGSACGIAGETFGFTLFYGLKLNPCNPVGSFIGIGVTVAIAGELANGGSIADALYKLEGRDSNGNPIFGAPNYFKDISAVVGFGISVYCSVESDPTMCGPSGWTTLLGSENKGVGQAANILIAYVGMSACLAGPEGCIGYAIYTIANDLFSLLWDWLGPRQFHGSLQPRPSVPNQADILNTLGVPINGSNLGRQAHRQSRNSVPSPAPIILHGTAN
jgi:RHS repeat-associated protein